MQWYSRLISWSKRGTPTFSAFYYIGLAVLVLHINGNSYYDNDITSDERGTQLIKLIERSCCRETARYPVSSSSLSSSSCLVFVTKHGCDRQADWRTDEQNYDSQDRAGISASRGKSIATTSNTNTILQY